MNTALETRTVYVNSADNARLVGWDSDAVADYVSGPRSAPYVLHDHRRGFFLYTSETLGLPVEDPARRV